jgi:hypothetical protein
MCFLVIRHTLCVHSNTLCVFFLVIRHTCSTGRRLFDARALAGGWLWDSRVLLALSPPSPLGLYLCACVCVHASVCVCACACDRTAEASEEGQAGQVQEG